MKDYIKLIYLRKAFICRGYYSKGENLLYWSFSDDVIFCEGKFYRKYRNNK